MSCFVLPSKSGSCGKTLWMQKLVIIDQSPALVSTGIIPTVRLNSDQSLAHVGAGRWTKQ